MRGQSHVSSLAMGNRIIIISFFHAGCHNGNPHGKYEIYKLYIISHKKITMYHCVHRYLLVRNDVDTDPANLFGFPEELSRMSVTG